MNIDLLKIYLNDHLAGATVGVELARRILRENKGNPVGQYFQTFVPELEEDRATVEAILLALGQPQNLLKQGLGWALEKLGRLKLNGRLIHYSPLSRVMELEGLCIGTEGRLSMWRSLRTLANKNERLARFDFGALIARAEQQLRTLERLRQQASDEAFSDSSGSVVRLTPSPAGRGEG